MMKNFYKIPKFQHYILKTVILLLVTSCGISEDPDSLPPDTSVVISPPTKPWSIGGDVSPPCAAAPLHNSYHTVSVRNGNGQTLLGVPVSLSMDLSAINYTGLNVLELFIDINRNNIPEQFELVSAATGSYDTDTSDVDGTLKIIVRMNLSCWYGGSLVVQAGATSGSAEFTVSK